MKTIIRLGAIAVMLAYIYIGCANAQSKDSTPMLIDKLGTNFWIPQTLLRVDEHEQEQLEMVAKTKKFLQGNYRIAAQRIYLLVAAFAQQAANFG